LDDKRLPTKIDVRGLTKRYGARTVVDHVFVDVNVGEVVGLLGPNGAGKTTTFYMVVGLVKPNDGSVILVDDQGRETDITHEPMHLRAREGLGYLAQETSVFRRLSVSDNLRLIWEQRGVSREEQDRRLPALLEEFGLTALAHDSAETLSGGERRRVEITRALAAKPRFMLLDEPFAGIDPISVVEIQRIVRQLKARGIGILITDHNVRETLGICDRAYIMSEGAVLAKGAPADVLANDRVREVYLGKEFRM